MKFDGARAVITGGASGLGAEVARLVIESGGRAAVLDRARPPLQGRPGQMLGLDTDVTNEGDVARAVAVASRQFGGIDLCVTCAGIAPAARVVDRDDQLFPLDLYREVVAVNLIALFDVTRHCALAMSRNTPNSDGERGVIINVGSIAGYEGQVGQAAYAASKGGVIAMTLPLARDLSSLGVRVVTICPGTFDTQMLAGTDAKIRKRLSEIQVFPKRPGRPQEFADLVRAIVENPMLNGEVIRLDGAVRLPHRSG